MINDLTYFDEHTKYAVVSSVCARACVRVRMRVRVSECVCDRVFRSLY